MEVKNFLSQLTKKYSLSKTLRFELKPVGKTLDFIKENKIFEKDETIDESYHQAKFYFDELHREFIAKSLSLENIKILKKDFNKFAEDLTIALNSIEEDKNKKSKSGKKDKSNKQKLQKEIQESRENLYKSITKLFIREDKKWQEEFIKKNSKKPNKNGGENNENNKKGESEKIKFILSKDIVSVLKEKFPAERNDEFIKQNWPSLFVENETNPGEKVYIFEEFKGFTTYLGKFQQTRNNLYKDDGTSTAVATRIVENFERFLANKDVFEKKYKNRKDFGQIGINNLSDIFEKDYYLNCLLQEGIDIYNQKIGEINKKIKEYRDKNKMDKSELPLFRTLDKQILGKIEKRKELIEATNDKSEEQVFYERLREFVKKNKEKFEIIRNLIDKFTEDKFENEYQGIYLNRKAIDIISRRWLADREIFVKNLPHQKEKEGGLKPKKFVSILDIKKAIEEIGKDSNQLFKNRYYKEYLKLRKNPSEREKYFAALSDENPWQQFLTIWRKEFNSLFIDLDRGINKEIIPAYNSSLKEIEKLNSFSKNNKENIKIVKDYCDASLKIFQMSKYFLLSDKNKKEIPFELSQEFYAEYDEYYQNFDFIKYYDAFRNFITKKPYSEDKIKLNFESGALLTGFDKNKETEKLGIILRRENKYFLGIVNKKYKDIFDNKKHPEAYRIEENFYEKMELRLFPNPTRMIPKIAFAKNNEDKFGLTEEIKKIKKDYEEFQEDKQRTKQYDLEFEKDKLTKLIKYYQHCLEADSYKETFDFRWKKPEEYDSLFDFNNDVNRHSYKIRFVNVDKNYIDKKIESGELYLFEIYNKDFSQQIKGKQKNIHTLYFLNLFSEENLKNTVFKLGANAEVFYRKASDIKKTIPERLKGKKKNNRQVYKYNRYTEDKILFHLPIEINLGAGKPPRFNVLVNHILSKDKVNVIGIDRGEKNLLYYVVINQKGEILEHGSLNEINGVNYFTKLIKREVERQKDRQSWQPIAEIKDLKKGYISYAIHKITKLIENHKAIVVLEDLNWRFKQIRSGIERTIYQQFEKALIDKLGYLIFKDNREPNSPGGVLNGYQLTAPFESFRKIGKQTGILFYVNADYTSKTDPLRGFRKNIYIGNSSSQGKIVDFVKKCKAIGWDEKKESYFFTYDPKDFNKKNISYKWTVFSKVSRIRRERNDNGYWEARPIDLNEKFEDLFKLWGFKNPKDKDLKSVILEKYKKGELRGEKEFDEKKKNFFHSFIYLFNLILQTRNTLSLQVKKEKDSKGNEKIFVDSGVDFFASPVWPFFRTAARNVIYNEEGKERKDVKNEIWQGIDKNFDQFESKFVTEESKKNLEKFDSDGIGAYNIARKGLMVLNRIKSNPQKPDLFIKKEEWDEFVVGN